MTVNILWNNIANSGVIDIDGKTYGSAAELGPIFQAKLAATPEFRVVVRADKDVKYEFLRTVLAAAGGSGVSNVTFSVVDKEQQK